MAPKEESEGFGVAESVTRSQPPDLNPIENLWKELEIKVHNRNPQNLCELKTLCQQEWEKMDSDFCKKLTSNYCKRLMAVIANNGHATKY